MRETATYRCPRCGRQIRVLADEYGDHGCPCGWEPYEEAEALDQLRSNIVAYVERCVDRGQIPDAFAFAIENQREYGRVPGEVISEMITEEMAEYER